MSIFGTIVGHMAKTTVPLMVFLGTGLASPIISASSPIAPGYSDLQDAGLTEGFLFTGNTMYDYQGFLELELLLADVDPARTASLDGVAIQKIDITFPDEDSSNDSSISVPGSSLSSSVAATPEPGTLILFAIASICLAGIILRTKLRRESDKVPATREDRAVRRADAGGGHLLWLPSDSGPQDYSEASCASAENNPTQT